MAPAAVAALATMGLNSTRGDALKRAAFDRAKDASRGVQAMARKTSSAVKDAVDKKRAARRALAAAQRACKFDTRDVRGRTTRPPPRSIDTVAKTRAVSSVRACKTTVGSRASLSPRVNLSLFLQTDEGRVQVSLRRRRSKSLIINITTLESEIAARNARRERVLLRLKASMVSS